MRYPHPDSPHYTVNQRPKNLLFIGGEYFYIWMTSTAEEKLSRVALVVETRLSPNIKNPKCK